MIQVETKVETKVGPEYAQPGLVGPKNAQQAYNWGYLDGEMYGITKELAKLDALKRDYQAQSEKHDSVPDVRVSFHSPSDDIDFVFIFSICCC